MTKVYPDYDGPFFMRTTQRLCFRCCDCGLVHHMAFHPRRGGWIEIAMDRQNVKTANSRRSRAIKESIKALQAATA